MMKISNEKHAAVILKCLPQATADRFLAKLDPDSCRTVLQLMQHTEVTTEKLQIAIELLERERRGECPQQPLNVVQQDSACLKTKTNREASFTFLKDLDAPILLRLFNEEQPRNAATILTTMPKEFASTILKELEPTKRVGIIRHIAAIDEVDTKDLMELRFAVRLRIQKLLNSPEVSEAPEPQPSKVAAEVEPISEPTLHQLEKLSNKQIKKLLRRIDTSHLAPALKTLPIRLQKKVLRNMATKPAEIVSREMVEVRIDDKHRIERSSRSVAQAIKELNKK